MLQNHQLDEVKEENEVLKNTVGRLNQELSRYQAKFRPLSDDDVGLLLSISAFTTCADLATHRTSAYFEQF